MEREKFRERSRGDKWSWSHKEYSVFVSNLPDKLDRFGLKGIFQKIGRVCDVFIPIRRGWKSKERFGFVRFWKLKEANDCIQRFNGAWIRGNKVYVAMAKPRRIQEGLTSRVKVRSIKSWQNRRAPVIRNDCDMARLSQENQPFKHTLTGQKNEEIEEWLQRSLVCTVAESRDLATLSSAISDGFGQCFKLSALSSFKFLLTFPTLKEMEEALAHQEELHQWFVEVKRWALEEFCDNRRVWLDILGVPPHGWKWENFKMIAELWGDIICLGRSTANTDSFEAMRILIATKVFSRIEAEILLTLDPGGYRVIIREVETVCQLIRKPQQSLQCNSKEEKYSNCEPPGFEDIEDLDDHTSNHRLVDGVGAPDCLSNSNSNSNGAGDNRVNVSSQHNSLSSRTKTALLSQNGYSEELDKVALLSRKVINEDFIDDGEAMEIQSTPGFEKDNSNHDPDPCKSKSKSQVMDGHTLRSEADRCLENIATEPPGFERAPKIKPAGHISAAIDVSTAMEDEGIVERLGFQAKMDEVLSPPPGFDSQEPTNTHPPGFEFTANSEPHQRNPELNKKPISTNRRITRSQARKNVLAVKERPQKTKSSETSESLVKLAKESLEIGKILGVKVIIHEQAALRKITASLEENKRKHSGGRS